MITKRIKRFPLDKLRFVNRGWLTTEIIPNCMMDNKFKEYLLHTLDVYNELWFNGLFKFKLVKNKTTWSIKARMVQSQYNLLTAYSELSLEAIKTLPKDQLTTHASVLKKTWDDMVSLPTTAVNYCVGESLVND